MSDVSDGSDEVTGRMLPSAHRRLASAPPLSHAVSQHGDHLLAPDPSGVAWHFLQGHYIISALGHLSPHIASCTCTCRSLFHVVVA